MLTLLFLPTWQPSVLSEPDKWIERYADALFSYTYSRINGQDVAEDLVQDTFFSVLKAKDTFQFNSSEKT